MQAAIAAITARGAADSGWRVVLFATLAVLGLLIVIFGESVES
jgi:hypothetical protein